MCVVETKKKTSIAAEVRALFAASNGKTQLIQSYGSSPLKIAKPFLEQDGSAELCIMDCSPGLLAGDNYNLQFKLEENAQARIITQSFAKVHPSKDNPAQQHVNIEVGSSALLEYSPQPLILFRDAHLNTTFKANVAHGGTLILSDIICAGRVAHDEKFLFERYSSKLQFTYADQLIYCNQSEFKPHLQSLQSISAWGANTHWGSFYYVSEGASAELVDNLRNILQRHPQLSGGVSLMHKNGIVVSALGTQAWRIQEAFAELTSCVRAYSAVKV